MNNQSHRRLRLRRHRRNRRHQSSDPCVQRAMDEFFPFSVCSAAAAAAAASIHPWRQHFFASFVQISSSFFLSLRRRRDFSIACVYVCVFFSWWNEKKKKKEKVIPFVDCHTFAWLAWVALHGQPLAFSPLGASHHEPLMREEHAAPFLHDQQQQNKKNKKKFQAKRYVKKITHEQPVWWYCLPLRAFLPSRKKKEIRAWCRWFQFLAEFPFSNRKKKRRRRILFTSLRRENLRPLCTKVAVGSPKTNGHGEAPAPPQVTNTVITKHANQQQEPKRGDHPAHLHFTYFLQPCVW